MENLVLYLAKASGIMAVFYIAYHTLLKNETFFYSNRKFLIAGLLSAALLPLLVLTRTVWVEPAPAVPVQDIDLDLLMQLEALPSPEPLAEPFNWFGLISALYLSGVLFFLVRFVSDLLAIRKMLRGHKPVRSNGVKYIDSPKVNSPFSFFNYIVYNSAILTEKELESILNHEKVHSRQAHSLDMVISQLFCIAFWFNPFAWLYKKAVAQNLEFIADAEATRQINDAIAYQKALLKITVQPDCTAIINHFYQSLIKKRIVMLNKKQSKTRNSWKYAAVLPAIIAFMVLFQIEVHAQEKELDLNSLNQHGMKVSLEVTKDSKEEELNAEKEFFKSQFNTDITFSDIKRNNKGEITGIKVVANDGNGDKRYEINGSAPIKPFTVEIAKDKNGKQNISFGASNSPKLSANNVEYFTNKDSIFLCGNGSVSIPKSAQVAVISPPDAPAPYSHNSVSAPPSPPVLINGRRVQVNDNHTQVDGDEKLVILNGMVMGRNVQLQIPSNEEITSMVILDKKEAKKKYGKEGKKGALEINTRRASGRYTSHTFNSMPTSQMKMYIGDEDGLELEDMHAQIARMKELLGQLKDYDLAMLDQFKVKGLTNEEINSIREQLLSAQEQLRKISSEDMQTFKFNTEDFKRASAASEEARAAIAAHREELLALREEMRGEREKVRAEMEKAREEQHKAAEEQRKAAEEKRKKVWDQR